PFTDFFWSLFSFSIWAIVSSLSTREPKSPIGARLPPPLREPPPPPPRCANPTLATSAPTKKILSNMKSLPPAAHAAAHASTHSAAAAHLHLGEHTGHQLERLVRLGLLVRLQHGVNLGESFGLYTGHFGLDAGIRIDRLLQVGFALSAQHYLRHCIAALQQ